MATIIRLVVPISNWWNPFSWGGPSYGIGYDGIYPSYDSTYIDGNSRGWYNAGGWYGQTARPYYGYGRGLVTVTVAVAVAVDGKIIGLCRFNKI
jgi:hypothetical protein